MVTLTGNQPHALEAARAALTGVNADSGGDQCGRVRSYPTAAPSAPPRRMTPGFPEPARSSRIRRGVGDLDNLWTTKEIVYGIASLLASPNPSGCYERQHWTVGNRLHWTRDVTSHENFPQLRTSTAARALASCRNLALSRDAPTSPMPDETSTATTTLSRSTHLTRNSQTEQKSQRPSPGFVSDS